MIWLALYLTSYVLAAGIITGFHHTRFEYLDTDRGCLLLAGVWPVTLIIIGVFELGADKDKRTGKIMWLNPLKIHPSIK